MENLASLQITPLQISIGLAINIWMYVIFPIIIIRKLNYMKDILEAQYYKDENQEDANTGR